MAYTYVIADGRPCPGSQWNRQYGVRTYHAPTEDVPRLLQGRTAPPHSWAAHVERLLNHRPFTPPTQGEAPVLRPHQRDRAQEITAAFDADRSGYFLGYPTGSGKTFISVAAVNQIQPDRVLVISSLSHVSGWRSVITRHATGPTEWVVMHPAVLHTLFRLDYDSPYDMIDLTLEQRRSYALSEGELISAFDMVFCDESQILAHAETFQARLWRRIIGWSATGEQPTTFAVNLSATPATVPEETAQMAHLLAQVKQVSVPPEDVIYADYGGWLRDQIGVDLIQAGERRWFWERSASQVKELTRLLYDHGLGATATREDLGLPAQPRSIRMLEMSARDKAAYAQHWAAFREAYTWGDEESREPSAGQEEYLRSVQKAAVIKAPYVADLVVDYLSDGYQVVVPAWFHATVAAIQAAVEELAAARGLTPPRSGRWTVPLTGTGPGGTVAHTKRRDLQIQLFQSGWVQVIITSVSEAISLHAGQKHGGMGGEDATDAPRVTIFGDVIHGGKKTFQAEGRASRDGQVADAIYCVAAGTAEVGAFAATFRSLSNTRALTAAPDALLTDADAQAFLAMADDLDAAAPPDDTQSSH